MLILESTLKVHWCQLNGLRPFSALRVKASYLFQYNHYRFQTLENRYTTLDAITDRLMEIFMDLDQALPNTEDMVKKAWKHARELARYAKDLDE